MNNKKDPFEKIIDLATQPLPSKSQKQEDSDDYTSKKTHQHNAGDASEKQHDKSH